MSSPRARAVAFAACLALAAYLRLSGLFGTLAGGEVAVTGPDAAFHARRMLQTWQHFPHVPIRDVLLDWPHGAVVQWPPGFDLLGALLALPFSSRFAALIAFSSLPVLLGLALVVATARATHALVPRLPFMAGACAAFVVAVVPQAVSVARFSNTDHHVAEALIMLALGMWSLWACRALVDGELDARRRLAVEAAGALACFGALWLFVGSTAYVAIAVISLGIANVIGWRARPVTWAVGAPGLFAAAVCTALLYRPVVQAHGLRFDYVFPSYLQPLLVAAAGAGCAAASAIGFIVSLGRRRALVGASLFAGSCALLALVLAAHPATAALRHGVHEWFGGGNALLTGTTESVPLFAGKRFWEAAFYERCHRYYGLFGLLGPLFFALAALASVARRDLRRTFPFWIWTLCIVTMALYQNRFGRLALINLAIAVALALAYAAERLPRARALIWSVPLALFAIDPAFHFYLKLAPVAAVPAEVEAGAFLRAHARPARFGQRSGVLTPWDLSHFVVRYAERPVTATGFGFYIGPDTFDRVEKLWLSAEPALLRFMDERDLGYVMQGANGYESKVLRGRGAFVARGDGRVALNVPWFKALPLSPLLLGGSGLPAHGVLHLERLLPLQASGAVVAASFPLPRLWVYERVRGATLRGRATPNAVVRLRVPLRAHRFAADHEAWTVAGSDGAFTLVTPLPTGYRSDGIETGPRGQLLAGETIIAEPTITEAQVRAGGEITIGAQP